MDETNCLGIQSFAEAHSCLELQQKARCFALKHFPDLITGEEFEAIPETQLIDLISSDELEVHREEDVFSAIVKWVESSVDVRYIFCFSSFETLTFLSKVPCCPRVLDDYF